MRTSGLIARIAVSYRRVFSISEIEQTSVLQWMFGVSLFFFFVTFERWISISLNNGAGLGTPLSVCWPYFEQCKSLYFLTSLPDGYSQTSFYMALYAVMLSVVYCMWSARWTIAHALLSALLMWKLFMMFVVNMDFAANYDYYHVLLTIVMLFFPLKEQFLKISFVVFYFLAASSKFHETWILGDYFTPLKTGLPFVSDAIVPIVTNAVICLQVIGSWFLLSRNHLHQRAALLLFALFHLYSGILVLYRYPSIALTSLLVLFGPLYRYQPAPRLSRTSAAGYLFLAALFAIQLAPLAIRGDQKLTLEGNYLGFYMFEANHQCTLNLDTHYSARLIDEASVPMRSGACYSSLCVKDATVERVGDEIIAHSTWASAYAMFRCDPHAIWSIAKTTCLSNPAVTRVAVRFDHSINGGPFYRIIDDENLCAQKYRFLHHNEWIALPPAASIVGYPVKNFILP